MDISSSHSALTTYGGWAIIAASVGYYVYQKRQDQVRRAAAAVKQIGKQQDRDVGDAKKKAEKATKPKPKPKTPASTTNEATSSSVNYNWEQEEAAGKKADREFARQLADAHSGTKFASKKSEEKRQKSVKQSKAQEINSVIPEKNSVSSSTTGDADDDLSPQASPVVAASDSHDVSDMLEPTAPGPSVLRLTDTDSVKKPKERKAKVPERAESKKQRQNRKKAEAAKAAREEDEKERKVLLEQQRRTARIAEGRAAKDGSASAANTQNAWNAKPTNGGDKVQLLDTSDQQSTKPEPTKSATLAPAATKVTTDSWSAGMPSEEEQMEMLRQEDSWSEVKTKKKGKKRDNSADTALTPAVNGGNKAIPTAQPQVAVNGTKKPILTSSSSSFAALTPDETDDNDEIEKEWDV